MPDIHALVRNLQTCLITPPDKFSPHPIPCARRTQSAPHLQDWRRKPLPADLLPSRPPSRMAGVARKNLRLVAYFVQCEVALFGRSPPLVCRSRGACLVKRLFVSLVWLLGIPQFASAAEND